MAIYHLSVKTISRSAGRSATASAAYRAGEKIADQRTGEIHDYTRKGGVESADLVLPENAPDWASDRAALWNAAEQAETRKNSTVAREFEIALPSELSPEERRRLAVDFAREIVARHGCAADVAVHAPGQVGDPLNHHAHILVSTRRLAAEGFTGKTRELDDQKSGEVNRWRARFAELQNERLWEAGAQARVDHRTLEAQGIDREPARHLGPAVSGMERRGASSEVGRRMAEEAIARLHAARERGRTERELAEASRAILGLTGDLADAIRAREERQREAERPKGAERTGPAVQSFRFTAKRPEQATPPQKAERPNFEAMPIETQCKAWDVMLNKMAEARRERIAGIEAKSLKRLKRREKAARASMAARPERPTGLLASLRQRAYDKAWAAWNEAYNRKRELEQQAIKLSYRLRDAATGSMAWATRVLKRAEPELARRVETHRQAERAARLRAEMQEREQKRQAKKNRGPSR
ncbi:MAG: MobQ family relaxase [Anaerolineales bacterium]|nr:MobQ family relaxase [Anaerolineales bacterium]